MKREITLAELEMWKAKHESAQAGIVRCENALMLSTEMTARGMSSADLSAATGITDQGVSQILGCETWYPEALLNCIAKPLGLVAVDGRLTRPI